MLKIKTKVHHSKIILNTSNTNMLTNWGSWCLLKKMQNQSKNQTIYYSAFFMMLHVYLFCFSFAHRISEQKELEFRNKFQANSHSDHTYIHFCSTTAKSDEVKEQREGLETFKKHENRRLKKSDQKRMALTVCV